MRHALNRRIRIMAVFVTALALVLVAGRAAASGPDPAPPHQGVSDDTCLACHNTPGLTTTLASGEPLFLTVDRVTYKTSTHGRLGYACVQCHTDIQGYPHPEITAATVRDFTLQMYTACQKCHVDKYASTLDSVHQKALAAGNPEAAVCTDCHGAHNVQPPAKPRSHIPQTCERCHSEIYKLYRESVHGSVLIGEGNPDVPTCTDCHGVHNVAGPSTESSFHLFSPQICAQCHANRELMSRYGISTDVFETYVSDFHGSTVVIFERTAPDQETNKPVCIDCHGVHDMKKVDDPESRVIKENLLATCQKCHPDASANFPTAWLSHYRPSPEHAPLVYYVNLFYQILIPGLIGAMTLFVVIDGGRRILQRRRKTGHE